MNSGFSSIKKIFKMKYNLPPILQNRVVLYLLCFMSIINIMYFASVNDIQSVVIFALVGFLTTFFNKNMIVILVLALCVTHLLKYGASSSNMYEGLTNADEDSSMADAATSAAAAALSKPKSDSSGNFLAEMKEGTDPKTKAKMTPKEDTGSAKPTKVEMMAAYDDYHGVQEKIVDGIKRIQPLLEKAETFIQKYESYKGMEGNRNKH